MSIMAAWLTPERAVVITDTAGFGSDLVPTHLCSKVMAVPHIRAVLVQRGAEFFAVEFYRWLNATVLPEWIDDVAEHGQSALLLILREFRQRYGAEAELLEADPNHQGLAEVVVFGWSPSRRQMAGLYFTNLYDFRPVPLSFDLHLGPPIGDVKAAIQKRGRFRVPQDLVWIARQQVKLVNGMLEGEGGMAAGGEIVVADLTRTTLDIRTVGEFDGFNQLIEGFGYAAPSRDR